MRQGVARAMAAAAALGAFSALGDWLWARYIPDGAILPGLVHAVLFFLLLALLLGWAVGSRRALARLLPTLPLAGLLIAALFYPLAYLVGYLAALLIAWTAMWLAMALLGRWACRDRDFAGDGSARAAAVRGTLAAIGSGVAFWSIAGVWTDPDPAPNYWLRWLLWAYAFSPGMLFLLVAARGGASGRETMGAE